MVCFTIQVILGSFPSGRVRALKLGTHCDQEAY